MSKQDGELWQLTAMLQQMQKQLIELNAGQTKIQQRLNAIESSERQVAADVAELADEGRQSLSESSIWRDGPRNFAAMGTEPTSHDIQARLTRVQSTNDQFAREEAERKQAMEVRAACAGTVLCSLSLSSSLSLSLLHTLVLLLVLRMVVLLKSFWKHSTLSLPHSPTLSLPHSPPLSLPHSHRLSRSSPLAAVPTAQEALEAAERGSLWDEQLKDDSAQ